MPEDLKTAECKFCTEGFPDPVKFEGSWWHPSKIWKSLYNRRWCYRMNVQ